ncbi:DUF441 domain-containing protein [Tepidibacillus infernus]|uniref:UPF0756 membrane protein U473_01350 n=1 Tax=Tepidibacillus decaturensis TaxID=1413211 RepID=A0A135L1J7_9BACI|nr:DUF441 domain-containing protein [Tepidibacillus decaturensis]KXG42826.1 hypothetical protein U473_01350 [Tepidibacillus decaturensis]
MIQIPNEIIFLILLLGIGLLSKNQSIVIAVAILLVIRLSHLGDRIFPLLDKHGMNIGIIMITIAVLVPIAKGKIQLQDLIESFKSSYGIIAIISGMIVALFAANGIQLLEKTPQITIALVLGTIFAVVFLKGIPVGPLIGAGIAVTLIKIFEWLKYFFD